MRKLFSATTVLTALARHGMNSWTSPKTLIVLKRLCSKTSSRKSCQNSQFTFLKRKCGRLIELSTSILYDDENENTEHGVDNTSDLSGSQSIYVYFGGTLHFASCLAVQNFCWLQFIINELLSCSLLHLPQNIVKTIINKLASFRRI